MRGKLLYSSVAFHDDDDQRGTLNGYLDAEGHNLANAQEACPAFLAKPQFKENLLSVPGYVFEEVRCTPPLTRTIPIIQLPQAKRWKIRAVQTLLAEGTSLKDGSNVLAKIAPATRSGQFA